MSDKPIIPRWAVFKKDSEKKPHQMVGSVYAPDGETALLEARTVFGRRPNAVSMWVALITDVVTKTLEEMATLANIPAETATDETETWHVFSKTNMRRAMTFVDWVGEVEAFSAENAIRTAAETIHPNKKTWVWLVVADSAVVKSDSADNDSWFAPALTKKYKQQSAYGFVGKRKRE